MNVYPLVLGPVQTTCYVVSSQGRAVIVDPAANATKIIQYLGTKKLIPEAILLTHGHFDHIGAVNELAAKYSLPIYAHKSEKEYFDQPEVNLSTMTYQPFVLSEDLDYHWLADGATLTCLDTQVKIFHVPGHTSGSLCYYFVKDRMVFTGDTLFKQSIGRTDFIYGNHQQLVTGIRQKLLTLPDDTLVYPGHGDCTTVADEKRNNPFLNN
ncbi:MAG: MBL fold metallo-hydrolase [Turicibacter sp.]|uniref:MBL fold metallo-hydrolase n=1 Tax=unclassified Turicibacter TaxID=2638206 RepID=UPI00137AAF98|nr:MULTISPECIES: MBL fold metallo-hydrolase [unclassified Turicibacter]MCI8702142.1 MBL fold metallo-hydrolase [Turicibacter sp.]MCI9351168.1 MBL fold metallo-hydrolase [Turicibacter sp.]MCU7210092.1 MBL fold metallo-hydrolase [Turicibacter sp. 1E2]NCE78518.1 MBL fold metallo-hydrolase [Turicibacter sp. TS3]